MYCIRLIAVCQALIRKFPQLNSVTTKLVKQLYCFVSAQSRFDVNPQVTAPATYGGVITPMSVNKRIVVGCDYVTVHVVSFASVVVVCHEGIVSAVAFNVKSIYTQATKKVHIPKTNPMYRTAVH